MGNILKRYTGTNWESVSGAITGDTLPVGSIVAYSSNNAPTNWLICDGSAVNRVTYANLFSVIGTTYGAGDGTTTFNLPNAKGRTIVGLDITQTEFNAMGKTGGSKYLQEHDHKIGTSMTQFTNFTVVSGGDGGTPYFNENNKSGIAGTGDSGNLQPYLTENIIIKAFQSVGVVGNVVQTENNSTIDTYSCNYINKLTGTILYQNDNGTTANITLNDNIENYKYYEVIPFGNERNSYKTKVGQSIMPNYITMDGIYCYVAAEIISISGTSLTHSGSKSYYGAYSNFFQNVNTNAWYSIYQVIGYK